MKAGRLNVTKDFSARLIFPARGSNPILAAGSTSQFTCPFREYLDREGLGATALDNPIEARIAQFAEYKTPLWWAPHWFQAKQLTPEARFTLDTKNVASTVDNSSYLRLSRRWRSSSISSYLSLFHLRRNLALCSKLRLVSLNPFRFTSLAGHCERHRLGH